MALRTILVICTVFCFGFEAKAENWHRVMGDNSAVVEVETDTIQDYLVYKEAWWRINFHINGGYILSNSGKKVYYSLIHQKFNCVSRKTSVDVMKILGDNGVVGAVNVPQDKQSWIPIDPTEEVGEKIYNYLCKNNSK